MAHSLRPPTLTVHRSPQSWTRAFPVPTRLELGAPRLSIWHIGRHVDVNASAASTSGSTAGAGGGRGRAGLSYEDALGYARANNFKAARVAFENVLRRNPMHCKAWVSYAQMEKRCALVGGHSASHEAAVVGSKDRFQRCRTVLQRGLTINPNSACLVQAFGLMELQRGNWLAAILLLERSVKMDPRLQPVLNWSQVDTARKTVGSRRRRAGCSSEQA